MSEHDDHIDRMSRAARTSLFDVACDHDLMISLILANLMSPALWEFHDRIGNAIPADAEDHQHAVMAEIARYVNSRFFHVTPQEISEIWGLVEIEAEAVGARRAGVMRAVKVIADHSPIRMAAPGADRRTDLMPYIERGLFPEYLYTNLDVVHANRRVLGRMKHKPYGITCCADEAILIASLACALDGVTIDDIVIIGSVEHYTTFIKHSGETFWFNGKREFFDAETWRREITENAGGDPQAAFDARLKTFDHVITPHGVVHLHSQRCSLDTKRWRKIRDDLTEFFGTELRQIAAVADTIVAESPHPMAEVSLAELDQARSAEVASEIVARFAERYPGCAPEAAFYGYRTLDVRHPDAYVQAALREHRAREAAAGVRQLDEALGIVGAIEGSDPLLSDRNRLALPDEVLLLKTGSDRDKALLLYALLHHAADGPRPVELIITDADSYVLAGEHIVSLGALAPVPAVRGAAIFRHDAEDRTASAGS